MGKLKEEVKKIIDKLPEEVTFDDLMYELYVNHQIQVGLDQLANGQTVTHEEAKKRLLGQ